MHVINSLASWISAVLVCYFHYVFINLMFCYWCFITFENWFCFYKEKAVKNKWYSRNCK